MHRAITLLGGWHHIKNVASAILQRSRTKMGTKLHGWLVPLLLVGTISYALAEEPPSPPTAPCPGDSMMSCARAGMQGIAGTDKGVEI